jgi:hypothetical protein
MESSFNKPRSKMNKAIIGWIFAVVVLLGCLAVIGVAAFVGYGLNNDLTKTKADLVSANDTLTQTSADLDKAKTNITKLNGDLTVAQDQATQLQTNLDDMTTQKTAAETKFNATICETTGKIDFSSQQTAMDTLLSYVRTIGYTAYGVDEKLYYGINGFSDLWIVDIVANKSATYGVGLDFFLYRNSKTAYFAQKGCWVQPAE